MNEAIAVDDDIIHDVANSHAIAYGSLKARLRMPVHEALPEHKIKAIEQAYQQQADRNNQSFEF